MPTTTEMVRQAGAPIVPFDHHSKEWAARHIEIAQDMLEQSPVAWTEAYGGFWVLSRYEDVRHVLENWKLFSSENRIPQGDRLRRGVIIPPVGISLPLNESDPPRHTTLRMIEAPYFTPKYLRKWTAVAADFTTRAIDAIIESGEGDLVKDICARIPVMTTLALGGANPEEWEYYSHPLAFHGGPEDEAFLAGVMEKLHGIILDRRRGPRDDMATALANASVEGEPLATEVAVGMLHVVLTGGFDTAISILCDGFSWLEENPDKRDHLRNHPQMTDNAADEFMRMWPPVLNLIRNVTQDVQIGGFTLRAGDQVSCSTKPPTTIPAISKTPTRFNSTARTPGTSWPSRPVIIAASAPRLAGSNCAMSSRKCCAEFQTTRSTAAARSARRQYRPHAARKRCRSPSLPGSAKAEDIQGQLIYFC